MSWEKHLVLGSIAKAAKRAKRHNKFSIWHFSLVTRQVARRQLLPARPRFSRAVAKASSGRRAQISQSAIFIYKIITAADDF